MHQWTTKCLALKCILACCLYFQGAEQMTSLVKLVMIALLTSSSEGVKMYYTGGGIEYRLDVTQDVTLERASTNFNYLQYLIVSKHPDYPNKRSLVQFEDLPSTCHASQIHSAKMYLYYEYAHKASSSSDKEVPFIPRYLKTYLVKKPWIESQTTSKWRLTGIPWSSAWLGLDGSDAEATPQKGTVTISPDTRKAFVEFDVTNAVKSWSDCVSNNGLVIRATNELDRGRDIRFASNAMFDSSKHAYIQVRCLSNIAASHTSPKPSANCGHTSPKPSTIGGRTSSKPSTVGGHTSPKPSATKGNIGAGIEYRLDVTQDVTLERGSTNFNYLQYLIVSKHPDYPNKRSLVQFEDLPSTCHASQIHSAKMYLYYEYAHKASWYSVREVPFIPRYLKTYLVKKPWIESQTTSKWRLTGIPWSSAWLGLDGSDAEATPQRGTVTISPETHKGFVEFDVTNAVKSWSSGVSNNGLVIRATNELDRGRDIRFASNAMFDSSKHAYILVRCLSNITASHTSPKPSTMKGNIGAEAESTIRDQISHPTPYHDNSPSSAVRHIPSKFDDQFEHQYKLSSSSVRSSSTILIFGFAVGNVWFLA